MGSTHEVTNQPPPLLGHDVFGTDAVLREAVVREGAAWAHDDLHTLGTLAGTPEASLWGRQADEHPPVLRTHDRFGRRIDEVEFHPAYHDLLGTCVLHGLHATPWSHPRAGAHVARAAGFLVWSQVDAGVGCPTSMTYAAVGALGASKDLLAQWLPALGARRYDPTLRPVDDKVADGAAALVGMAMTEKQGGSDVRANTTRAVPEPDGTHRLTGHKWFCSAPMSDGFLMLAQAPEGLTCFLVPRVLPDGGRNAIAVQRLKDKLGNRSNASAEIELDGAVGLVVGEPGRGVATIVEMVALTRGDCVIGTSAIVRQAVAQAIHHAQHRSAFGALLVDAPLMQSVLADLAIESEAATSLAVRLAAAVDRGEQGLRRVGTAVGKYYVCKRGPLVVAEALECLGGNGYVEESGLPKLYREAPVNSVWEGSGNVNALDVVRVLGREPLAVQALLDEVELARGGDQRFDAFAERLADDLAAAVTAVRDGGPGSLDVQRGARRLVERMALALQGSLVVRHSPAPVADAFCATRLAGDWGETLGTLPASVGESAARAIVDRHAALPA